jgi:hypothetical protein
MSVQRIGQRRVLGAVAFAAALGSSCVALAQDGMPGFMKLLPSQSLADALDDNYGHIQVSRIALALQETADAKCVAERKLTKVEFDQLVRHVLMEVDEAHGAAQQRALDQTKAEELFTAEAGQDVVSTVTASIDRPEVRPYLDPLGEFRRMERVKTATLELQRLMGELLPKKSIVFEPRAADDRELIELEDEIGEVVERAIAAFEPKIVHAFTTYEIAAKLALEGATPEGAVQRLMPPSLLDVIRAPLEAHCVGAK